MLGQAQNNNNLIKGNAFSMSLKDVYPSPEIH